MNHPPVRVIITEQEAAMVAEEIIAREPSMLGVDFETRQPNGNGYTDVIQVRDEHGIYIFHLAKMGRSSGTLPAGLRRIFLSPEIKKVANHIRADGHRLNASHACDIINAVELSFVVIHSDPDQWPLTVGGKSLASDNTRSLAALALHYLQVRLLKGKTIHANWDVDLTKELLSYAAEDVDATYRVYQHVTQLTRFKEVVENNRDIYSFDYVNGRANYLDNGQRWKATDHPNFIGSK